MKVPSFLKAIPRKWRTPKLIIALFALELPFSIAALALYGIAQPDLYRTRLWQEGSNHGWNSNPNEVIYAYANYRPIPDPLPWSQFITNFNVVIAVLSVFILLVKGIMWICHVWHPLLSAVVHAILVALFAVSTHAQTASDMSDPEHPQKGAPWYVTRGCGSPVDPSLKGYCEQARASLAVTVLLLALFAINTLLALLSLYPSASHRRSHSKSSDPESASRPWEMMQIPPTPGTSGGLKSPTTPRTMAFQTLGGERKAGKSLLGGKGKGKGRAPSSEASEGGQTRVGEGSGGMPLRHHISMGEETYGKKKARFT